MYIVFFLLYRIAEYPFGYILYNKENQTDIFLHPVFNNNYQRSYNPQLAY